MNDTYPRPIARRPAGESETLDALHREIERDRCRAILIGPHAELRERQARYLAFETDLSAAEAVGVLRGAPIDPPLDDDEDDA